MAVDSITLNREEIVKRIDDGSRRRLNLPVEAFIRAYRDGRLDDPCSVSDLLMLANLLDDTDPLFVKL